MSNTIEIIGILTPKPGAIEEVIEALAPFNKYIEENESGALKYAMYRQMNTDSGKEDLVYIETYKDMQALEVHRSSGPYMALQERGAKEQLLSAAPEVKIIQQIGGFSSRA